MDSVPRSARAWRAVLLGILSLPIASPAPATEFWLAPWGSDGAGRGLSASNPARTPQGLESHYSLRSGDRIWVSGGTYQTSFVMREGGAPGQRVVYEALPGQPPVISGAALQVFGPYIEVIGLNVTDSPGWAVEVDSAPGAVLRRLVVNRAVGHGISLQRCEGALVEDCEVMNVDLLGIRLNVLDSDPGNTSPGIVVRRCKVHDVGGSGLYAETDQAVIEDCEITRLGYVEDGLNDHGIYSKSKEGHILRNRVSYATANGISVRSSGLVDSNVLEYNSKSGVIFFNDSDFSGGELLIQNNIMRENTAAGVWVNGVNQAQSYVLRVVNNTVYGRFTALRIEAYNGQLTVANNILAVTGSGDKDRIIDAQNTPTRFVERNNLHSAVGANTMPYYWAGRTTFAGYRNASGQGLQAVFGDPIFVDAAGGDFHLMPQSPALDKGWTEGFPPRDAEGRTRQSPPDLGALESEQLFSSGEFWLAPWGQDAAGCGLTAGKPARTPQGLQQLYGLQPGNHVWLRGGTYDAQFEILQGGISGQPLVYQAALGETPVLANSTLLIEAPWVEVDALSIANSPGYGVDADHSPGLVLRNLVVTGSQTHGIGIERSEGALIENCDIRGVGGLGIRLNILDYEPSNTSPGIVVRNCGLQDIGGSGIYTETEGVTIENCSIERVGVGPDDGFSDHGIYSKSKNACIVRNRITDSSCDGISIRNTGRIDCNFLHHNGKAGIMFFNDTDPTGGPILIENNVIAGNAGAGVEIDGQGQAQNYSMEILNNTIHGSSPAVRIDAYDGQLAVPNNILSVTGSSEADAVIYALAAPLNFVERNNLHSYSGTQDKPYFFSQRMTFEEYRQASGQGLDAVFGNPCFACCETDDFHLQAVSAAIDRGWDEAFPASDAEGKSRLAPPDIGAFEYQKGHSAAMHWTAYQ